ncbi:hypothetical protein ACIQWI_00035 [Peribacillus frigoritolerans]
MNQLYLTLNKAGLMFKGHTKQGEIDFIHLETDKNGTQYTMTAEEMGYQKWKVQGLFNYRVR